MEKKVLQASHIHKYFDDPVRVKVLDDIHISIDKGEFVAITGKSGCGKSTLLYILSTMDTAFEGELMIDGVSTKLKSERALAEIRNEKIGFVFQFHYLLNEFTVLKNVMIPALKLNKFKPDEIEHRAMKHLENLGINDKALKKANQLSGGEKQRVAIARALINDPLIIMGDEPTGNLDSKNTRIVYDIFQKICEEINQTLLIVTHDPLFANQTHRIILMDDGKIIS